MNSDACQAQWDTSGARADLESVALGDACRGVTWGNFAPMIYIPFFAWLGVFILFFPLKKLYKRSMVPDDSTEVSKRESGVLRYVGTEFTPPIFPAFLTTVLSLQIFISLLEVFLFAAMTYSTSYKWGSIWLETVFVVFYIVAFIVNAIKAGFSPSFMFSAPAIVDFWTIVPILMILDDYGMKQWLTLKFLRVNRALLAYIALEKTGFVAHHLSELTRVCLVMLLKTMALTITMAGVMMVLETLGEPEFLYSTVIPTAMGDISFVQMIYWIFTTISTVGYGDFSPTTNVARLTIIVFIIAGVVFFSTETNNLLDVLGALSRGHGRYTGKDKHLVVVGGGVRTFSPSVRRFLTEILALGKDFQIVMLSGVEVSEDVQAVMNDTESRGLINYFQGSPMNQEDLARVKLPTADMAFVLADSTSANPDEEDSSNILRAMNINRAAPHLRMRVMILKPVNKMMAFSMGLPVRMCCSLNELKGNLMAQGCRLPGYSTLLLNLCVTDNYANTLQAEPQRLAECDAWQRQYFRGNNLVVQGCLLDDRFNNKSFWEAAKEIREETGDLLLAVQVMGAVMVFPQDHVLQDEDIVFVMTSSLQLLAQVAKLDPKKGSTKTWSNVIDYRPIFVARDKTQDGDERTKELMHFMIKEEQAPTASSERKRNAKTLSAKKKQSGKFFLPGLSTVTIDTPLPIGELNRERSASALPNIANLASAITSPFSKESTLARNETQKARRKEEAEEAQALVIDGGHILLLTCQPLWQQVINFIRPLRAPYLPSFNPIVVMAPIFPPSDMWDLFDDVVFVQGDPDKHDDLTKFGAAVAEKVVLLAGPPNPNMEERLADRNAMIANSVLESIFLEHKVDPFTIIEYTFPENSQILPEVPLCSLPPGQTMVTGSDESSISSPRFASGRIFVPSLFGSLFANSYTTPGIMELVEGMIMPSRRNQTSFPFMLPALERVAINWIGKTYTELAAALFENGLGVEGASASGYTHCMALGLYRRTQEVENPEASIKEYVDCANNPEKTLPLPAPKGQAHQGMSFVYCNPHSGPEEVLLPGDEVYVIAPAEWGRRVSIRGTHAELDNNDRRIFDDGCQIMEDMEEIDTSFGATVMSSMGYAAPSSAHDEPENKGFQSFGVCTGERGAMK